MKELEIRRTEVNTFFKPVNDTAAIEQLNKELSADGGRTAVISGCIDTQKVHISSAVAQNYKFMLVITWRSFSPSSGRSLREISDRTAKTPPRRRRRG